MDGTLNEAMQAMNIEKDVPMIISNDEAFSTMEQSGRSLIGRLLNPECQNMSQMLRTMPQIWKIYERVRGIALTNDTFQFIFKLETDLTTVMKHRFWTIDDWGMVMDRIATTVDHVEKITYDPEKPLLYALILLDVTQLVRDTKSVNLPKGAVAVVDVEYERIRKKSFHCHRLTHEKQRCPLFQAHRNEGKNISGRRLGAELQNLNHRQHHMYFSNQLIPLLAPSVPPGFAPPSKFT
ncbi:unnamed protein product [Arabis nemorensis]|uniref:DUF4283 domain-containing protein n=1 Tax=Arabis nemorensis TaxID=586526 RepID=A0A565AS25_9BRAS|nr:unnamed protein product [Arabis nemorensis]